MQNYKQQFKNKKITLMRIGLLGRGVGDAAFLAECGAQVLVVDDASQKVMQPSVNKLKKYKNIRFKFGKYDLNDFKNCDFVLKGAGTLLDSIEIAEARKHKIPIKMDVSLFAKSARDVMIIGVTGTRGKSMVTALVYEILKKNKKFLKRNVYIGGNVRGIATLPLLKKVKTGDILVCELDSWQLQGFGDAKISPHISIFTSFMPDHMNYYKNDMKKYFKDKTNIFKYQKKNDILIIRPEVKKLIPKKIKSKLIIADAKDVDKYNFIVPGEHQRENLACAVEVAKLFNIPIPKIAQAIKGFKGLEGRLQYVKTIKGVKIYNDNNATTIHATMAGLEALGTSKTKNIVLIMGGTDKIVDLDLKPFAKSINKYCKDVIFIPGTGTDRLIKTKKLKTPYIFAINLKKVAEIASGLSKKGNIILFSPAFASFGMFKNEYDRGDQFLEIIKNLK